jgi:excisionase family DNA binding protein
MPSNTTGPRATVRNTIPTPPEWRWVFGDTMPALLSVPEAAELTSMSQRTVRDMIFDRRFATVRIGRMVRIPTAALLAYMAQVPPRPAGQS